jgi:D-glycero-alpha-D-manno-heptose-7-phosphate kinase
MIISKTPYRVSFFGGGTDYTAWLEQEEGAVLSTSIDKYCYISVRQLPPFFDQRHRIVWSKIELTSDLDEIQHPAIKGLLKEYFRGDCPGLEIHHQGDLPARSGIGSSSSFAVGLVKAVSALKGRMLSRHELAQEAIRLEQDLLRENVGCQDQIAAAFGGLNLIEMRKGGVFSVEPVTVSAERYDSLNRSLLLYFTGTTRIASEIAGDLVRKIGDSAGHLRKMRQMVYRGIEILTSNRSLDEFGYLLDEAWEEKKRLSSLISNPHIDSIYENAKKNGALGGKLLGAGASGFMVFYVPVDVQARFRERMGSLLNIPFSMESEGSTVIHYSH